MLEEVGDKKLLAKRPRSRASGEGRKPGACGILEAQERNYLEESMSQCSQYPPEVVSVTNISPTGKALWCL